MNKRILTVFWADNITLDINARRWQLGKLIILWGGPMDLEEHLKKGIFEQVDYFEHEVKKVGPSYDQELKDVYTIHYKNPYRPPNKVQFVRTSQKERRDDGQIWVTYRQTDSAVKMRTKLNQAMHNE